MKLALLITAVSFFIACGSSRHDQNQVVLLKRYSKLLGTERRDADQSVIDVAAISIPAAVLDTSANNGKTLFDLQTGGQKASIEEFSKKDPEGQARVKELLNAQYQQKKITAIPGYVKRDFQLVFSTGLKNFFFPLDPSITEGDRIVRLNIAVTIPQNLQNIVRFLKWDKFTTQFGQYNIGGASFNIARSASLSPSVTAGGIAISLGSLGKTTTGQENDSLSERFVILNGVLTPSSITLQETGTPQFDLQGNTSVAITAAFPMPEGSGTFSLDNLINNDGDFQPPQSVKLKSSNFIFPQVLQDITLDVKVDYVFRHIDQGVQTFAESDDTIHYYCGTFNRHLTLATREDLKVRTWAVTSDGETIKLFDEATKNPYELDFSSSTDANAFLQWVFHIVKNTTTPTITLGGYKLATEVVIRQNGSVPTYLNHSNVGVLKVKENP